MAMVVLATLPVLSSTSSSSATSSKGSRPVASRAEPSRAPGDRRRRSSLPEPPSRSRGAVRAAATDLYYHSWRLVPANVVWARSSCARHRRARRPRPRCSSSLPPGGAARRPGIFRIATRIARGEAVSFWDGRRCLANGDAPATLVLGAGLRRRRRRPRLQPRHRDPQPDACSAGRLRRSRSGASSAAWLFAWVAWPILARSGPRGRSAGAEPRFVSPRCSCSPTPSGSRSLGIALAVLLVVSTVAVVALVTVSVGFAALVASALRPAGRRPARGATRSESGPGRRRVRRPGRGRRALEHAAPASAAEPIGRCNANPPRSGSDCSANRTGG